MKTLQIVDGDLQLDTGGRLNFSVGSSKLAQDILLWSTEQFGVGFSTPNFGSLLFNYIGSNITNENLAKIYIETKRVIELYRAQQQLDLQNAQNNQQLSYWNKSEIIQSINNIQVTPGQGYISIYISLTTLNNSNVNVSLALTPNGIQG